MELSGNYTLELRIGNNILNLNPYMIEELTIAQDIERLVPTFKLRINDATGILGGVLPYDGSSNNITISFARGNYLKDRNTFSFSVKRRMYLNDGTYEVDGVLKTTNLFDPYRNRAHSGNLKTILETIATDELGIASENVEVGSSLNYVKTVLQPYWSNSYFLYYLKNRIEGKGGETCYHCFIKNIKGDLILVFKSIEELLLSEVSHKFVVGAKAFEDFYSVTDFRVFDNSQFRAAFNSKTANYRYFNYNTGTYISSSDIGIDSCPSLSEYYLVDKDDNTNRSVSFCGRTNSFTNDFSGRIGQQFYDAVNNSINMWISTWGIENIAPGNIVKVLFSEALKKANLFVFQHSGAWMVKRVVHILGSSFMTNLLLTRCGVDTTMDTSLSLANEIRMKI